MISKDEIIGNMQNDRRNGDVFSESHAAMNARLREMGAENMRPPVPRAPCVKNIKTGQIYPWSNFFASRPDLCVACDENGDERWYEKLATPAKEEPVEQPVKKARSRKRKNVGDEHSPAVGIASEVLGVPPEFSVDYTSDITIKEAAVIETDVEMDVIAAVKDIAETIGVEE